MEFSQKITGSRFTKNTQLQIMGWNNLWFRFSRYDLITHKGNTVIVPTKGSDLIWYKPFHEPELLLDFLKLGKSYHDHQVSLENTLHANDRTYPEGYNKRDQHAVLRFCTQYGLLGLLFSGFNADPKRRSRFRKEYFPYGVPAAKDANRLLGDRKLLEGYAELPGHIIFEAWKAWYMALKFVELSKSSIDLNESVPLPWDHIYGRKPLKWAEFFADFSVGSVTMLLFPSPKPYIDFIGDSLYSSLRMMLLLSLVSADNQFRLCEDCTTPFIAKDPRAKFCCNRCSTRSRQRRFIGKNKSGKELVKSVVKNKGELSAKSKKTRQKSTKP
jgi:hypothetical protein